MELWVYNKNYINNNLFSKYRFKRYVLNIIFTVYNVVGKMVKNKKIFDVFVREKPAMMLVNLLNSTTEVYGSTLAKTVDCTYSHVVKILQEMEDAGLVSFVKTGRLKILTLTKKGEEVAKHIDAMRNAL